MPKALAWNLPESSNSTSSFSLLRTRLSPAYETKSREGALSVLASVVSGADQAGTASASDLGSLLEFVLECDLAATNDTALKTAAIGFCGAVGRACPEPQGGKLHSLLLSALVLLSSDTLASVSAQPSRPCAAQRAHLLSRRHEKY